MSSVYNKLLIEEPFLKDVLEESKEYNTTLNEIKNNLLSNELKYLIVFPTTINFKVDYDLPILIQNFLQDTFKIPSFNNMIMLENISTEIDESFKIILSKIPFEIIIGEDENYFDFIIEKNVDFFEEYIYKNISGFYLNVDIKSNENEKILNLYNYITPFKINKNQEIQILKKNEILKYNPFYKLEKKSKPIKIELIFIQGKNINTDENFIEDLIKKLKLKYTKEEILERIENNNILVRNQDREKNFDSYFCSFNYKKDDINKYLCRIFFNLYVTLDFEKQKIYMKTIFNEILNLLKKTITETIFEFNSRNLPINKAIIENDDVFMESIKIKKPYNNTYNYYTIKQKYNILFRYICKKNNINFGSNLLCIKKNKELNEELCFKEIDEFKNKINHIIDDCFENEFKNFLIEKKNFLNN